MQSVNGKVEISVEDYERLRDIERNLPQVVFKYDGRFGGGYSVQLENASEALIKLEKEYKNIIEQQGNEIAVYKKVIDKKDERLEGFKVLIDEHKRCIDDIKEINTPKKHWFSWWCK